MKERCYKCGRAYLPGEQLVDVIARPASLSSLKAHYTFKSIHFPNCPDGASKLKDRRYTHYDGKVRINS